MFAHEIKSELTDHIIPFWSKLEDREKGGFYGLLTTEDLKLYKDAEKGVILHSRILWFFANCYRVLGDKTCLDKATHAYEFLTRYCVDRENGGVYWSMNADGTVKDSMKHTYCQAFFIYALSTYYDASGDKNALDLALQVFDTIEKHCTDDVAYLEAMDREWNLVSNDALSENGLMADKTMNTILHLIEGYTELLRVSGNQNVRERLVFLIELTMNRVFDSDKVILNPFFDKQMNVIGDVHSYGHDIESTWLIDKACEVTGDAELFARVRKMNKRIAEKIYDIALEDDHLLQERENDRINKTRVWWVQAESVVGFYNAYQKYGDEKYKIAAEKIWGYIKDKIIDKREGSEWYNELDENEVPSNARQIVEVWKCPYHNGRMCMEIIERTKII